MASRRDGSLAEETMAFIKASGEIPHKISISFG